VNTSKKEGGNGSVEQAKRKRDASAHRVGEKMQLMQVGWVKGSGRDMTIEEML